MIFLSLDRGYLIIAQPETIKYHNMPNGMVEKETLPAKKIQFSPLNDKMEWPLPSVHGRTKAEGVFNSDDAVSRPGLTKQEAEDFLLKDKAYGRIIIGYGANGKVFGSGEDAIPEERIIVRSGDGYFCKLCKQQLAARGRHNHPKSKMHQRLLDELERDGIDKLLEESVA